MRNASFLLTTFVGRAGIKKESSKEKRAEKKPLFFIDPLMPPSIKRKGTKAWCAGEDSNLRSSDSESEILSS